MVDALSIRRICHLPGERSRICYKSLLTSCLAVFLLPLTGLVETIEQLRRTEAIYRGMFDNAAEGIYQSTPDGRYLMVNAALAKMYGYERPEQLLNQVSDIQRQIYLDPSFRARFKREIEQVGYVRSLEYQVRRCDGQVIWISESARAVRDENGVVRYYEGFIDDITARKAGEAERAKLEKQMLHAQKMDAIGTLAGGIAHDFNNILGAMLGYTELALRDKQITGITRQNLDAVLKSAERAKELIRRNAYPFDAGLDKTRSGTGSLLEAMPKSVWNPASGVLRRLKRKANSLR